MADPFTALQQLIDRTQPSEALCAASLHGLWCGRLCAGEPAGAPACWPYVYQLLAPVTEPAEEIAQAFAAFQRFAARELEQQDLGFKPWLPAETEGCKVRLEALSIWCQGFIEGLVSVRKEIHRLLDAEGRELLGDLLDIGEVDAVMDDDDDNERHLMELEEFVKVAVLNLHVSIALKLRETAAPSDGPTLH